MAGLSLTHIRSVGAAIAVFAAVLGLQLGLLDLRPRHADEGFVGYIINAQSIGNGEPYGMPGYIPNPHSGNVDSGQDAYPPVYPLVLAPVVAMAPEPVRAMAQTNAVLYAAFTAVLLLYALPGVGFAGALGIALAAGVSPVFANPGAFRAPGECLYLLLLVGVFLAVRRIEPGRRAGVGAILLAAAMIGLAALTSVSGILLVPALVLADLIRRQRLAWPPAVAAALGGMLFVGVSLVCGLDSIAQTFDVPGAGVQLAAYARVVGENLVRMPGNLMALWTLDGPGDPGGALDWAGRLSMVAVLALGALGFGLRVRGGITVAETFFVLQIGMLLGLTEVLRSPRHWLPVSLLALYYAVIGARAAGFRIGRRAGLAGGLIVVAMALGLAAAGDAALAARHEPYSLLDAPSQEAFRKIRLTIPPNAVLVGRRPQALTFFTERMASDYHLPPSDPAFWRWAAIIHASHLVLSIDQADTVAIARQRGLPLDDAGLRAALDEYEAGFFGPGRAGVDLIFDTGRYRLFRLLGPAAEAAPR